MPVRTTPPRYRHRNRRNQSRNAFVPNGLAVLCAALTLATGVARAESTAAGANDSSQLGTVIVEGTRDRAAFERQVSRFVSAVAARPYDESLVRWGTPICPIVRGMPRERADYVRARLAQIASSAGAPFAPAGRDCVPNLYIVATDEPDALLASWRRRDARLFGSATEPSIQRFVATSRPVRVWYNTDLTTSVDSPLSQDAQAVAVGATGGTSGANTQSLAGIPTNMHSKATFLQWNEVRQVTSAIVIVDQRLLRDVNLGQLVDYVAMLTLTQVNQDADVGAVGSILRLFSDPGPAGRPSSLSRYDEAYLRAMYHTDQTDKMQLSVIETHVTKDLLQ